MSSRANYKIFRFFSFFYILNDFLDKDYKRLLEDGAHPNSEGHEKIFETVKDFLIQNKIVA